MPIPTMMKTSMIKNVPFQNSFYPCLPPSEEFVCVSVYLCVCICVCVFGNYPNTLDFLL